MNRISAQHIREFTKVMTRDQQGHAKSLLVPGHEGRQYQVILRRDRASISAECNLHLNGLGTKPCEGNQHSLCYHSIAAIETALSEAGITYALTSNEATARKLLNIYQGKIYRAYSWNARYRADGKGNLFIVTKKS